MRSYTALLLLCLALAQASPRSPRQAVEGSGQEPEETDPDPAINEVTDDVETDVLETVESLDEESTNEMEVNTEIEEDVEEEDPESVDEDLEDTEAEEEEVDEAETEVETPVKDDRCKKCVRTVWRSRHDDFCKDCDDTEVTTPRPTEKPKGDKHRKKCDRCSKKGFYKRNTDFCDNDCDEPVEVTTEVQPEPEPVTEVVEVEEEVEEEVDEMVVTTVKPAKDKTEKHRKKCERCAKRGFYKKNTDFCDNRCDLEAEDEEAEATTEAVEEETEEAVDYDADAEVEENEESQESSTETGDKRKRNKHKNKKDKKHNRNKNKTKKQKNENKHEDETENKIEVEESDKKLGPLENLIKYLINQNTFKTH